MKVHDEKNEPIAHQKLGGDIMAFMSVSNEKAKGTIGITFDKNIFLKVASGMFYDEMTEINDENLDVAGELLNIIFGNVKTKLSGFGWRMEIPKISVGQNITLHFPQSDYVQNSSMQTQLGHYEILVEFSVYNTKD